MLVTTEQNPDKINTQILVITYQPAGSDVTAVLCWRAPVKFY